MGSPGARAEQVDSLMATFELTSNVNYLLRRAHGRADGLFHEAMADLGLTPRQAALLYAVAMNGGGSVSALSRMIGIDRGTLSEMIPRLIRRGLLTRTKDEHDGRAKTLQLTEEGTRLVTSANARTADLRERVLAPLPHEYRELFTKMLSILVGLESETRMRN